jgi:Arc/MetJ-type ribon-helix-helix transcriptional regulator
MNCDTYVRVRCTSTFKQKLKKAIHEGKAQNMSQLIRQAVEKMLLET